LTQSRCLAQCPQLLPNTAPVLPPSGHHGAGMGAGLGRLEVSRSDETATVDPQRRELTLGDPAADGVARDPSAVRGLDDGQEFGRAFLVREGGSLGGHSVLRRDRRFDHAGQAGVIR
jgi:hypothetical protein